VWLRTPGGAAPGHVPDAFAGWQRQWLAVPEVSSFVAGTCERDGWHGAESLRLTAPDGELLVAAGEGDAVPYATGAPARMRETCACGAGRALELT
jgi:hypothetical protein